MDAFLASIDYDRWILPALLIVPTLGALVILLQGAIAGRGGASRRLPVPASARARTPAGASAPASEVARREPGHAPESAMAVPSTSSATGGHVKIGRASCRERV